MESNNEIFIHGLGHAINRAANMALTLKTNSKGTLELATHTSTVELLDDLEPQNDDHEPEVLGRHNSAIHIKVFVNEKDSLDPKS